MLCVHSKEAREYARILEEDEQVKSFEVGYPLDQNRYTYVNPLDIRKDYFATQWITDFVLQTISKQDRRSFLLIYKVVSPRSKKES